MEITYVAISAVVFLVVGGAVGYLIRRYSGANKLAEAETKAKEIVLEAKEKAASLLVELKNEEKDRRKEIDALESRVLHREETLDKKLTDLSTEEAKLRAREEGAKAKEEVVAKKKAKLIRAWRRSARFRLPRRRRRSCAGQRRTVRTISRNRSRRSTARIGRRWRSGPTISSQSRSSATRVRMWRR